MYEIMNAIKFKTKKGNLITAEIIKVGGALEFCFDVSGETVMSRRIDIVNVEGDGKCLKIDGLSAPVSMRQDCQESVFEFLSSVKRLKGGLS